LRRVSTGAVGFSENLTIFGKPRICGHESHG